MVVLTENFIAWTAAQTAVKEELKAAISELQGNEVRTSGNEHTIATWLRTWYALYAKPNVRTATANHRPPERRGREKGVLYAGAL